MLEKFKTYASQITSVFAAGVVLFGVFKFINQSNVNTESNKQIKTKLETIEKNLNSPVLKLDSVNKILKVIDFKIDRVDYKVDRLKDQFTKHLSKDKSITKEELLQIINDLDEKKNVRDTIWVPWW